MTIFYCLTSLGVLYKASARTSYKTPPQTVPPLLVADMLPRDVSGTVACLHGRFLAMAVSLAPLFRFAGVMSHYESTLAVLLSVYKNR
jgi:hypothetical protein